MSKKRKRRKGHARNSKRELRKRKRKNDSRHKDRSYYIRKERESIIEMRNARGSRYREEGDWIDTIDTHKAFEIWELWKK